jgi:hypothetical protein
LLSLFLLALQEFTPVFGISFSASPSGVLPSFWQKRRYQKLGLTPEGLAEKEIPKTGVNS